jgi:hypothetical protein
MRFKEPEDVSADIWWNVFRHRTKLMHGDYSVGETSFVVTSWQAKPYWYEMSQLFKTEEEAKAWLATMYRLR